MFFCIVKFLTFYYTARMQRPNVYDYLKIIAIITMIIDHVWYFIFPEIQELRLIWRAAFPLFLFLVGYNHSFRWRNKLWFWWIVLQLGIRWTYLLGRNILLDINILIAIGLVRVILSYLQKRNIPVLEVFLFIWWALWVRYTYRYIDYGSMSLAFALAWYRARRYGLKARIVCICWLIVSYHIYFMVVSRLFPLENILIFVGIFLFASLLALTYKNTPYISSYSFINKFLIWIATYAIEIYVWHVFILLLLAPHISI